MGIWGHSIRFTKVTDVEGGLKGVMVSYFQWKLWYKKVETTAEELSRKRLPTDTNILQVFASM